MIDCLDTKICEAICCAAKHADGYVKKYSKGKADEWDFFQLILVDQYVESLKRYRSYVSLGSGCGSCGHTKKEYSCLSEDEVMFILGQLSVICGNCSCNC